MANPPTGAQITSTGSFGRDNNAVPIQNLGLTISDSQTLVGSGATVAVPIFGITGEVLVFGLWGVVTTALGNNTVAYFRLNDQTAQTNITNSTGTTLTGATAGSAILKITTSGSALTLLNASAAHFQETAANHMELQNFIVVQKTGGVATNIEFVYTTSDTPTTGAITFYLGWIPLSAGASVVGL